MPLILVLDTCGPTGFVALIDTNEVGEFELVAEQSLPGRETQERLMNAIGDVLAAGTGPKTCNLAAVAVVTGPGSFTGVRIGVAAAKGLAEATGRPLVACSRLAVLAEAARAYAKDIEITAWLDAGRTELYTGRYVVGAGVLPECLSEEMLPRNAAVEMATGHVIVEDANLAGLVPNTILLTSHEVNMAACTLSAMAFRAGIFADVALLDANYLRVPDAETALRARQAAQPTTRQGISA